jgi:hypothetical protein
MTYTLVIFIFVFADSSGAPAHSASLTLGNYKTAAACYEAVNKVADQNIHDSLEIDRHGLSTKAYHHADFLRPHANAV